MHHQPICMGCYGNDIGIAGDMAFQHGSMRNRCLCLDRSIPPDNLLGHLYMEFFVRIFLHNAKKYILSDNTLLEAAWTLLTSSLVMWFGGDLQKLHFIWFFAVQTFKNQSGYNLDLPKMDLG